MPVIRQLLPFIDKNGFDGWRLYIPVLLPAGTIAYS